MSNTVAPTEDNTEEGTESVTITVNYSNACQQVVSDTVFTNIVDSPPLELSTEELLSSQTTGAATPPLPSRTESK